MSFPKNLSARFQSAISRRSLLWTAISAGLYGVGLHSAAAAQEANPQTYKLTYKLQKGEEIVTQVEHFAETRTKMSDTEESSSSRTQSEKVWSVTDVNEKGEMTFEYRINQVQLTQSVGSGEAISYDSASDEEVPDVFKPVAETVGRPLATVTINPRGQVVDRDKELKTPQLGMGELTIPLPEEAVAIGGRWSVPREVRVKLESGAYKKIKVRELYTLEKVATGVATIRIVTQPLTPVNDPAVESQLIQQLSKGELKFDIDKGRLIAKRLDWSEEVVGFRGPETSLRYDGKFVETLLPQKRTASRKSSGKR
ncbi:MAG: hypothetical protein AAGG44_08045 [Planctomycetota bacterium]